MSLDSAGWRLPTPILRPQTEPISLVNLQLIIRSWVQAVKFFEYPEFTGDNNNNNLISPKVIG